jgi:preprotein translocase subunit SecB
MAETQEQQQPGIGSHDIQLSIQKIYVKDLSFETPNSPQIFLESWAPEINVQLRSAAAPQSEGVYEVILTIVVTAKQGDRTAYLAEVHQAGIFNIAGGNEADLGPVLGSLCPSVLFPFAREVVAGLVAKGGFPQFLLSPVNFDALYMHTRAKAGQGEVLQ